mgnify:CR=1 FL=1
MAFYNVLSKSVEIQADQQEVLLGGLTLRGRRVARNVQCLTVRMDGVHTATIRVPAGLADAALQDAIVVGCQTRALGQTIAPGVQVVEYEERIQEARDGEPLRDSQGTVVQPPQVGFPGQPERTSHAFVLLLEGVDLFKTFLSDQEFRSPTWQATLLARVPVRVRFTV